MFRKVANSLTNSMFSLSYWKWVRLLILVSLDTFLVAFSYWAAFLLRFDGNIATAYQSLMFRTFPILIVSVIFMFYLGGLYRQVWRFANLDSVIRIGKALSIGILIFLVSKYFLLPTDIYPRSIPIVFFLLCFIFVSIARFSWRLWSDVRGKNRKNKQSIVIYGAGSGGDILARHLLSQTNSEYYLVGFLDDDRNKHNRIFHGHKIFGALPVLKAIKDKYNITTMIIAMPSTPGKVIREIVLECRRLGITPLIKPDFNNTLGQGVIQFRPIDIKDLLRRSPRSLERTVVESFFAGTTVLITGAGGSIGSEIARQISECRPIKIVLLDASEFNLYKIELELRKRYSNQFEIVAVLGSVTDEGLINSCFKLHQPTVVMHAAAYKHVPILEHNPLVAVTNNIIGTQVLVDASIKYGVKRFLLISTDKAVRPTSVMGASKRCCELLVQAKYSMLEDERANNFCVVRFGNVLGSSGSVVPLFLEQLQNGGPITVTDPEMTRYFMLISEAVELVLQSIAISKGGEIFILNMGDPVKILDMANQIILLSGKQPGRDVEVKFTGIRPGEKLYEELTLDGAEQSILQGDVFVAESSAIDSERILRDISDLIQFAEIRQVKACKELIQKISNTNDYTLTKTRSVADFRGSQTIQ